MSEWRPIETAKDYPGYIIGAWQDGGHWRVAEVFNENDEWVDVFSDRIHRPTHWMPCPDPPTD